MAITNMFKDEGKDREQRQTTDAVHEVESLRLENAQLKALLNKAQAALYTSDDVYRHSRYTDRSGFKSLSTRHSELWSALREVEETRKAALLIVRGQLASQEAAGIYELRERILELAIDDNRYYMRWLLQVQSVSRGFRTTVKSCAFFKRYLFLTVDGACTLDNSQKVRENQLALKSYTRHSAVSKDFHPAQEFALESKMLMPEDDVEGPTLELNVSFLSREHASLVKDYSQKPSWFDMYLTQPPVPILLNVTYTASHCRWIDDVLEYCRQNSGKMSARRAQLNCHFHENQECTVTASMRPAPLGQILLVARDIALSDPDLADAKNRTSDRRRPPVSCRYKNAYKKVIIEGGHFWESGLEPLREQGAEVGEAYIMRDTRFR